MMKKHICTHKEKYLFERVRSDGLNFYTTVCALCGNTNPIKKAIALTIKNLKHINNDDYSDLIERIKTNYYNEYTLPYVNYIRENNYSKNTYNEYLNSDKWRIIRNIRFEYDKGICQKCYKKATQVHHKTYQRLGREKLGDLVSLCGVCHKKEHKNIDEANKYQIELINKNTDEKMPF